MADDTIPPESKEVRVLKAKIKTKQEEIKSISQTGPVLVAILGVFILFIAVIPLEGYHTLWDYAIVGIVICGFAVWWYSSRENQRKKVQGEIAELEAELE